jgi:hypothetical protein
MFARIRKLSGLAIMVLLTSVPRRGGMRKIFLILLLGVGSPVLSVNKATAFVYFDSFEGNMIDPFWETFIEDANGGISAASSPAAPVYSGSQSLQFHAYNTGSFAQIEHDFDQPMEGEVSVWLYNGYPGDGKTEPYLELFTSLTDVSGRLINSWQYSISHGDGTYYLSSGSYPFPDSALGRQTTITIPGGWHKFDINVDHNETSYSIDNILVFSVPSLGSGFNAVSLGTVNWGIGAPFQNTNENREEYYFDDFNANVEPVNSAVPEPATISLLSLGLGGSLLRRKRIV